jgi:L-alanine-DL-glutamate epimerase-like enolase superfamily enzyme
MLIERLAVDTFRIPLPVPMEGSSTGVMRAFDMVMVRISTQDGASGVGYTVMHEGQGPAIAMIIDKVFRDNLMKQDSRNIEFLWHSMWQRHHYAGRGAPVSFAIAAVDTALWDLKGRALGQPLWQLLGGFDPRVKVYAGNIDLNLPAKELLEGASRSIDAGHRSVKMRLGKPTLAEDLTRAAEMRKHIGDDIELLADANEAWTIDRATRATQQLAEFDLIWLEEPLKPDDFAGYAHLRQKSPVPLAAGENLHTLAEFRELITRGCVDFPEPDLTTCGGITPFMKVARLAEAHSLPLISHGAHQLHIHLLAASPNAAYLEIHAFGLERFMKHTFEIDQGYAVAPDRNGHGIEFDIDALMRFRVS